MHLRASIRQTLQAFANDFERFFRGEHLAIDSIADAVRLRAALLELLPVTASASELFAATVLHGAGHAILREAQRADEALDDRREERLLFRVAMENAALASVHPLMDESWEDPERGTPETPDEDLLGLLTAPQRAAAYSLEGQLEFVLRTHRDTLEREGLLARALYARSLLSDEARYFERRESAQAIDAIPLYGDDYSPFAIGTGQDASEEPVRYAQDTPWMPNVVLVAKSTLVWLHQLTVAYGRPIRTLRDVPDEELEVLARRGITGLWLIGLWNRSEASRRIKVMMGQPDAAASAYAVRDYEIADELGGEDALLDLRTRALRQGIRLACDLVPNHWGLDAEWVASHPDHFMQVETSPFPSYAFTGPNLSSDPRIEIYLEDGYRDRSDAAVVFKHVDVASKRVRYMYHGNDGTTIPWNDTAQLDYLKAEVRSAVIRDIVRMAKRFPIIRFDAAMVLAKQHVRRLWYPAMGEPGGIASRGAFALTEAEFDARMPNEFWRDVAQAVLLEAPDTLLLAEAFWMMEGYFVKSLGMHRVYNSAFMNMLRHEENAAYRSVLKNVLESDRRILERFVNFMNNPDELPAALGFGDGDKYLGVCTLLATMPGLPMFGHGQFEGFTEKYGMEYRKPLHDEVPNQDLVRRHEMRIVPLLRARHLWSGTEHFELFDFVDDEGEVDENVFAYANGQGEERVLVVYNNGYPRTRGTLRSEKGALPEGTWHDFYGVEAAVDLRTHTFALEGYGCFVWSKNAAPLTSPRSAIS